MLRWTDACSPTAPPRYHPDMDTRLLELLVCPVTKGPLEYNRDQQELISRSARLAYPVRDGIPILLDLGTSKAAIMPILVRAPWSPSH